MVSEETALERPPAGSRAATLVSLAGIVLMAAAILYGFYKLHETEKDIAAMREEIVLKRDRLTELQRQVEPLQDEVDWIRNSSLVELIEPRAIAVLREGLKDQNGNQLYNFIVWLELPHARKVGLSG